MEVSVAGGMTIDLNLAGSLSNHATFKSQKLPQHLTYHKDSNGIFH